MSDGFFVVVALGDSLTFGYRMCDPYAIDPRVPYPAQLETLLREKINGRKQVVVINAGVNGDSTDGMLWRFGQIVARERPDVVVVWGGINDLGATQSSERVMEKLMKLYTLCGEIGATPVACTLTPTRRTSPNMTTPKRNDQDTSLGERHDPSRPFRRLADGEGNLRQEYSDDGAHLTQAGYRRVAEIILDALTPIIEKMEP